MTDSGSTRTCPHCKAVILDSAVRCPACLHYLHFEPSTPHETPAVTAFEVEGTIQHPEAGGMWEYQVVAVIRDEEGREINRQLIGVGSMRSGEKRHFSLAVEVIPPRSRRGQH